MALTEKYVKVNSPAWVNATVYALDAQVLGSDSKNYYCILAHTSETGVKGRPIDGTDWATYWALSDGTTQVRAWTLSQAIVAAVAGDRVNIQAGTYVRGATDTLTADGSVTQPIIWRGCDASWNPIVPTRNSTNLLLDTTSFPFLDYSGGNYALDAYGADNSIFSCLRISSGTTSTTAALRMGNNGTAYGCSVTATANDTDATAMYLYAYSTALNCDAACTGASSSSVIIGYIGARVLGCYITDGGSYGIRVDATPTLIAHNVISGCDNYGILLGSTTTSHYTTVIANTIFGLGIAVSNAAYLYPMVIVGNHVTNSSAWAFYNPNATGCPVILAYNRTRDNASGETSWVGDWATATTWAHVTEIAGGADGPARNAAEFVASGGSPKNFNLKRGVAAVGVSFLPSLDIGGLQRTEPTIPADEDVQDGVSYGDGGTELEGDLVLPAVGDVEAGVQYGGDGTEFEGTFVVPAIADVEDGVFYGEDGTEFEGTLAGGAGGILIHQGMTGGMRA